MLVRDTICGDDQPVAKSTSGLQVNCNMPMYVYPEKPSLQKPKTDTIVPDFEKAFAKVSHTLLVHRLCRYGIGSRLIAWIDSFLENRQQAVVVGERDQTSCLWTREFPRDQSSARVSSFCTSMAYTH